MKLREHPHLLGLVLVALVGLAGVATIRVATAPADRARMLERPPSYLGCGAAVSEWLEEHGDHDFDEHD